MRRILALKSNRMSLIDEKTKLIVKSKRMSELRSWLSDEGYYNIASLFSLNPSLHQATTAATAAAVAKTTTTATATATAAAAATQQSKREQRQQAHVRALRSLVEETTAATAATRK